MSHLPIWYLGNVDEKMCDQVVADLHAGTTKSASMGVEGEVDNQNYRNTDVFFAPFDYWFAGVMELHAAKANSECKWGYEIPSREAVQLAKYGVNQHYGWHVDNFPLSGKDTDRKVSVVCLLNDPSEFEGGEFQIRLYQDYAAPLKKGTLIAFPSILEHRVTPVLSGVRYSATMWLSGPRFR